MTEQEILNEQNKIKAFKIQSRNLILPQRTISYQFQNMRNGNRNITQQIAIRRKQRKGIRCEIKKSEARIISLRDALLGVVK